MRELLTLIAAHSTETIVGSVLLILGVLATALWMAGTKPTRDGAHEPIGKLERQQNAMNARIHAVQEDRWQGATAEWSPMREMPPARPLEAHLA